MKTTSFVMPGLLIGAVSLLCLTAALTGESSEAETGTAKSPASKAKVDEKNRVTVEVARDRARVMHDIYEVTLDVIHHRYFRREKSVIPARAMEDVFSQMNRQSNVEARWISVNLKAMSIDHEPETDFERTAAQEIAAGKSEYEVVENGYYRRAAPIPLTAGCISCHAGFFKEATQTPKYAGLVISIPLVEVADAPK